MGDKKPAIEGGRPVRKNPLLFSPPSIGKREADAVVNVLKNRWLTMGEKTIEFENELKNYVGAKNIISVSSCTAALHLSLVALGISGGEVITSPMTFAATGNMIINAGAKPVFVDIEEDTMNIDCDKIENSITNKTRAIIPVHYGGNPCDMDKIKEIAEKYDLVIIEDAAHAIGAEYKRMKIGSEGTVCFSFYATKNITTGEGGAIATDNNELAERLRILRLHGIDKDAWKRHSVNGKWYYNIREAGWKYNLTDMQSALGIVQLKKLDGFIDKREKIAEKYIKNINQDFVKFPVEKENTKSAWHLFPIRLDLKKIKINREKFIEALQNEGIQASVHFIPLHLHPLYQKLGFKGGMFPVAERCYEGLVSLPLYPDLTDEDVEDVAEAVNKVLRYFAL